ncbi:MAG: hypothetical protein F9K17_04845 [Phycisphaerae bacterium]|nr:MAG: hypothetical protein F9K17_04845 [Phycisphaerae bacterium]
MVMKERAACVAGLLSLLMVPLHLSAAVMVGWGNNSCLQLDPPLGANYVGVVAGDCYTLVLDGTGTLSVLGTDWIADGIRADIPEGERFIAIRGKRGHALAQRADGTLVGLGANDFGQASPPVEPFVSFVAGSNHSLAIRPDGTLAAWGFGDYGQTEIPEGNDFVAIDAGEYHNLALRSDHTAFSWGWYGGEVAEVSAIAAGWGHCLVLRLDGSLYAWGTNGFGELNVPEGNDFVAIWAGGFTSAAMRADGTFEVWGNTAEGEEGVPEFINPASVSFGFFHGVALAPTGDCQGSPVASATCIEGRGKVVAKIKDAEPGATLTCWLDAPDGPWQAMSISERGRGKAVFRGLSDGEHFVTVCDQSIRVACAP